MDRLFHHRRHHLSNALKIHQTCSIKLFIFCITLCVWSSLNTDDKHKFASCLNISICRKRQYEEGRRINYQVLKKWIHTKLNLSFTCILEGERERGWKKQRMLLLLLATLSIVLPSWNGWKKNRPFLIELEFIFFKPKTSKVDTFKGIDQWRKKGSGQEGEKSIQSSDWVNWRSNWLKKVEKEHEQSCNVFFFVI